MGFLRTVESAVLNAPVHLSAQALDDMGNCQNYGPILGPYYNTGPNLGDPKRDHNFDNSPYSL